MTRTQLTRGAAIAAMLLLAVFAIPSSVQVDRTAEHGTFLTLSDRIDWELGEIAKVTCRLGGPCTPPGVEKTPAMSEMRSG